jgi:hypothetical protein
VILPFPKPVGPDKWFNTSLFLQPPAYNFGDAPRTFADLRNDRTRNVDLSLHKNTGITEKLKLQFRAEFFNMISTARFGSPNQSPGNKQFGVISSQVNQPRIIQFALKLT